MAHNDQIRIPAAYMRGGSSKAMFFREGDIPPPGPMRDTVLKRLMGTPDIIQIDGMGGAKAVTSKIAIIAPSTRDNVDIDYTFAQVGVREDSIDYKLNCGNISAAVGPYAVDENLIPRFRPGRVLQAGDDGDKDIKTQEVRIYNTGTEKLLIAHVPVDDQGRSITNGTCAIAGVPGTAAPILLDYRETTGAGLNRGILPTGNPLDVVEIGHRKISFTVCDVANVYIFASASDFNVSGHESAAALTANTGLLGEVNELRGKAAQMLGMCADWEKVDEQSPFIPMVILVAAPPLSSPSPESHVSGRLFLDNMCHESMAGTGSMAFGACSRVKGSVVFNHAGEAATHDPVFNIAHPLGVMQISVETNNPTLSVNPSFKTLSFVRTARRLMDGHVYVPRLVKGLDLSENYPERVKRSTTESKEEIPVTKIFAEFIASVKPDVLSDTVVSQLKDYILDYVGVTVAAAHNWESTESIYQGILALGATGGSNTVILKGQNFRPQFAGLLNATFGHSMDFDDTYALGTLHAGVSAISAGLTQTELLGEDLVDTQHFLLAVAVGYEIICRLGRELANDAYARGFHNTGTAGIFGAVATVSVLKRLPAKTIENAFGLAVSKAAGSMQYLENGSWNKRLHPGFAVHDAFVCVALAEAGVIGAAKSIEGKFGFLQGYSPKPDKDLDYLTADLGARWTFLETALKPFPACRMTHGLIEIGGKYGSLSRDRGNVAPVQKITVSLSPANLSVVGLRTPNKLHPENVVDAQFSAYFQLAHAWLYGSNTGVKCYERLKDGAIYDLSEKIDCVEDVTVKAMGAKMHIQYVNGEQEQIDIPFPLGEPEHPFTREQVEDKYFGLVVPVLGKARAEEIRDLVRDLEAHSVVDILNLVC